ncbi:MAG: transporter substrate-binding domain-containing protein [Candidatus Sericytochromatia bacterium]|nr:transporter substrate-binding domain-containing protein [Candidatus Sericytochromatia bacterium]
MAAETLRVGVYPNPPKIFQNAAGSADGFFPQVLNAVAAAEGWQLQYQSCDWQQCLEQIEKGRLDLLPDVAWSPERAARYRFNSEPVLLGWSEVYTRPGLSLQRITELQGLRVAVLAGSQQWQDLAQLNQQYHLQMERLPVAQLSAAFEALEQQQADAAVVNQWFGQAQHPYFAVNSTPLAALSGPAAADCLTKAAPDSAGPF